MADIVVVINGTDSAAKATCSSVLDILTSDFKAKLQNLLGVSFYRVSRQITQPLLLFESNVTQGLTTLMCSEAPDETFAAIRDLLPDGALTKTIAEKTTNLSKIIWIGDSFYPSSMSGWEEGYAGCIAVLDDQITGTGYPYKYSLRTLLEPQSGSNITLPKVTVILHLPVTANVLECYPSTALTSATELCIFNWSGTLNIRDFNVSYVLAGAPNVVVLNYSLSPTIPSPGTEANLTLTVKNVGTAPAYNVSLTAEVENTTVIIFTNSCQYVTEYIGDKLDPGQTVVRNISVTANATGKTTIDIQHIEWAREPNGPQTWIGFWFDNAFEVGVGSVGGPLLVATAEFSPWCCPPGLVSLLLTVRNDGTGTARSVRLYPDCSVVSANTTIAYDSSSNMNYLDLGDIPGGSSKTVNITTTTLGAIYNVPDPIRTGGYTGFPFALLHDDGDVSGGVGPFLLLPGCLPPDCPCFVEVSKTPDTVTVSEGDVVNVSVTVKNLGLSPVNVSIVDSYPVEMFEVAWGSPNATGVAVDSGCSVTLSYGLRAKQQGTVRLPPAAAGLSLGFPPFSPSGVDLVGTPLSFCSEGLVPSPGGFSVDFTEVAGLEVSGYASGPLGFTVWNGTMPAGSEPPSGVTPLGYFRLECNVSTSLTLKIHYDVLGIGDEAAGRLIVYVWDGTSWVSLPTTVDLVNKVVVVQVSHLSYFALGLAPPQIPYLLLLLLSVSSQPSISTPLMIAGVIGALGAGVVVGFAVLRKRRKHVPKDLEKEWLSRGEAAEVPTVCPFCGTEVKAGETRCRKCGALL
ncbi:MAG: CARDB domain-containing protein, partial [Candidatus Freyarchaeota archaeon]